jgi:hypothetical protein
MFMLFQVLGALAVFALMFFGFYGWPSRLGRLALASVAVAVWFFLPYATPFFTSLAHR